MKTMNDFIGYARLVENETKKESTNIRWILDSGASAHMTGLKSLFDDKIKKNVESQIIVGNGGVNKAIYSQDIEVTVKGETFSTLWLRNVLCVPELISNVISIPQLTREGYRVEFLDGFCIVKMLNEVVLTGHLHLGHFSMETCAVSNEQTNTKEPFITHHHNLTTEPNENIPQELEEPNDWKDVKELPEAQRVVWENAMHQELNTLEKAKVWDKLQCNPQETIKKLPCRWTFKKKVDENNRIVGAKARLVVKGCFQRPGYDYTDTFAPVVNQTTIKALLTIAGKERWATKHCDVNSAFLYGSLDETIYMESPPGPWGEYNQNKGVKLQKALYGLKQAAKAWNNKIHESLTGLGMTRSNGDPCLYMKKEKDLKIFIIIHVDDLLIFSNDNSYINNIVTNLREEYGLKDLGEVSRYLGIDMRRNPMTGIFSINQRTKICKIVEDLNLKDSPKNNTPMITGFNRSEPDFNSEKLADNKQYQQTLGSLMYISNVSRPDISISTNILGRSAAFPTKAHWEGVKRIVKYLGGTIDLELILDSGNNPKFRVFCDADWGGDHKDRKSTSGGAFFLGNSLIGWHTRKQKCIAMSTAEAEYVALSSVSQEITWMNRLMKDVLDSHDGTTVVYTDSQSCMAIANSGGLSGRSKHIELRYHYSKQLVEDKIITLKYCPTNDMIADIFTKPLEYGSFVKHRNSLSLI